MNRILLGLITLVVVICGVSVIKFAIESESQSGNVGLANPAAVYCKEMGYGYKIESTPQGQVGICVFPDRTECDEWAFFRGECGQKWAKLQFEVGNCSDLTRGYQNYYVYDSQARMITAFVTVNCGSDEIKVGWNEVYRIIEKDYDGQLLRCLCQKEVKIFNASDLGVEFINLSGEAVKLEKRENANAGNTEFCGWSTFGKCNSDKDCIPDGCSGQVCRSIFEEPIITTCEWKDCYEKRNVRCACVNNACQWIKI